MDNLLDELMRAAQRCERAAALFEQDPVKGMLSQLTDACHEVGKAWSGSFIGYHATVYIHGLRPKMPGEYFSSEWGPSRSNGDWEEYTSEVVAEKIDELAGVQDMSPINDAVSVANTAFDSAREDALPALDAILDSKEDRALRGIRDKIGELKDHWSQEQFAGSWIQKGQFIVRDPRAQNGGFQAPQHLSYKAWLMDRASYGMQAGELANLIKQAVKYLQYTINMKGNSVAKTHGTVFIGHGRSVAWRDLKDFLQERLGLQWDEFNREPAAGYATKERLEEMLDKAVFAFVVMTAEDEQADGKVQARANVIHEAGLFQGRLGFQRAIILLEEGCSEFSNIVGLGQVRFPKGNIMAASEEIRRTLEREKII